MQIFAAGFDCYFGNSSFNYSEMAQEDGESHTEVANENNSEQNARSNVENILELLAENFCQILLSQLNHDHTPPKKSPN